MGFPFWVPFSIFMGSSMAQAGEQIGYQLVMSVMRPGLKNGVLSIDNHFCMETDKYFEIRQTQYSTLTLKILGILIYLPKPQVPHCIIAGTDSYPVRLWWELCMMTHDSSWHTPSAISIWFPLPLEEESCFIKSVLDFLSKYIICQDYLIYLMAKNLKWITKIF